MKWRFRYYVDGNVEIPHGAEMHASTVNKVHRTRNSEKEAEVTQSQAILEYLAFGNARERENLEEWKWSRRSGAGCVRN